MDRRALTIAAVMIALILVVVAAMAYNLTPPKNKFHPGEMIGFYDESPMDYAYVVIIYDQEYDSYLLRDVVLDSETGKWKQYRDSDDWYPRKIIDQICVKIGKSYFYE